METIEQEWFAVRTRYQHERIVESGLAGKGFRTFLPTYKETRTWGDRRKVISSPLFPGYMFATDARERKSDILTIPGACDIVSIQGVPAPIPQEEMDTVLKVAACAEGLRPYPFLRQGDSVKVVSGPLAGIDGVLVKEKSGCWLVISIQLMGRSAAVAVDRQSIVPVWSNGLSGREREIARILFEN